ncbi:MAG TPA: hypothetical protein VLD16_14625 [Gaiellaceae bacterium]|nr:hypothetical protein [Gaiellaceae bacterium]
MKQLSIVSAATTTTFVLLLVVSSAAANVPMTEPPNAGAVGARAASAAPVRLRTLARSPGVITAFAQDGPTIAWASASGDHYRVRAKNVSTGKSAILGTAGGSSCHLQRPMLAVGGDRVLWTSCAIGTRLYIEGKTTTLTEQLRRRKPRPVGVFEIGQGDECSYDAFFAGAAGDGRNGLVYGSLAVRPPVPDSEACDYHGFDRVVGGGGVELVGEPPAPTPIPNVPAPVPAFYGRGGVPAFTRQLSVSQGHVAVLGTPDVIAGDAYGPLLPGPAENGPVSTYTLGGTLVSRVFPPGTVREVALSWPHLAVLVRRRDGSQLLAWYDAARGARETYVGVPQAASDIALGPPGIVFRIGNGIYSAGDGAYQLLWLAKTSPVGLSIEGRRVAWGVNSNGLSRIVAFTFPSG